MTSTNTTEALEALTAKAARSLAKYNAAGEPLYTWAAVVNGRKVQVRISGWENETTAYWVGNSDENLTLAQAAEAVAA